MSQTDANEGSVPKTTHYYYDGQNIWAEYDGSGTLLRYYVHGPTYIDERVLMHDEASDSESYHYGTRRSAADQPRYFLPPPLFVV